MKWALGISCSCHAGINMNLHYVLYARVSRITELKYVLDPGHRLLGQLYITGGLLRARGIHSCILQQTHEMSLSQ